MGQCYGKLSKTTSNSSTYNAYSPTEYSSIPTAKNLPLHQFNNRNCSTEWSLPAKNLPLLRLPFFALLEVFKSLDPIELFILSQCSRKAANCVHIVGTKKWKLSVDVFQKRIKINDIYRLFIIESSRNNTWKYDDNSKDFFYKYQNFGNGKLELQKALAQLQTAFRCPVTSFTGWSQNDQCWVSVLDYIIQNQTQPMESFDLYGEFKKKDLEWALQNVKVSQKINIHLLGTLNFTSSFRPECEHFTFLSIYPVCLDLMTFKSCKYLKLSLSLTMHDLNVFMKEWKTGSFPNLQYMFIGSNQFDVIDDILGFRKTEMSQSGVWRTLVIDKYYVVSCNGGADIQADNGTKATMKMNRGTRDWFELFVWNN